MKKLASVMAGTMVVSVVVLGSVTASADHDHDHDHDQPHHDAGPPPAPPPPTSAHGTNFQVKNGLDNNFCMDVAAGATEGRSLSLNTCSVVPSQRWGFSWNVGETNSIIESQGMCADVRGRRAGDGVAIAVYKCHHAENQKFTFTSTGHIIDLKSNKCLSVPRAGAGVAVFLEDCDETKKQQSWKLAQ
jgi:Ricin-type beta-trefoil lectin domain